MDVLELGRMVVVQVYQCLWLSLLLADLSWHTALLAERASTHRQIRFYALEIKFIFPSIEWWRLGYMGWAVRLAIITEFVISLVPRLSCRGGRERAWYTLFAHVLSSLGNLHTTPLH